MILHNAGTQGQSALEVLDYIIAIWKLHCRPTMNGPAQLLRDYMIEIKEKINRTQKEPTENSYF